MKYLIGGIVGGILATIWTILVFIGGVIFTVSMEKDDYKSKESK